MLRLSHVSYAFPHVALRTCLLRNDPALLALEDAIVDVDVTLVF